MCGTTDVVNDRVVRELGFIGRGAVLLLLKETSGFNKKVNPPQVMEVTLLQMLLCPRTHKTNVKSVTGIKRETSKIKQGQPV